MSPSHIFTIIKTFYQVLSSPSTATHARLQIPVIITCLGIWFSMTPAQAQTPTFDFSGYYKNLFATTQSTSSGEGITSDTQRLRLETKASQEHFQYFVSVDSEAVLNDFSNTPDFQAIRSKIQDHLASWDADKTSEDDHVYLKASVYRAYVQYFTPELQATLGKQAIDWGKMRFYSPLDVFNPVGPMDLEPEERVGVDALNVNFSPDKLAGVNAVVIPNTDDSKSGYGLRLYKNIHTYDVAVIASYFREITTIGVLFDGYIKGAGLRGEIAHTKFENGRAFPRASIGLDYNFSEKWYGLIEQFYNGGHDDNDMTMFSGSYLLSRQIMSLKETLTGVVVKYSFNPLTDVSLSAIYDWEGQSAVINPQIKYNITSNTDIAFGVQFYVGDDDSEFGSYEHLVYAEFKWFF